jgi:MoaA/NifB/PqqE/SkfB family radical SAM enzyme
VRWQNTCNFACVYCGPAWSSKWESELGIEIKKPSRERRQELKEYVFEHASKLENVYLAGGEPLLMTENEEFLQHLLEVNPSVALRVNTNLSKTGTKVFELITKFKDVHWTVSIEAMGDRFEYIRWGGRWLDFNDNLIEISKAGHKISFNMLWFMLNSHHLFETIDHLIGRGFQANSYVLGPITGPRHLDIRNLPRDTLQSLEEELIKRIDQRPGYLLEDGYEILLKHLRTPFTADLSKSMARLAELDQRRRIDSSKIFDELYRERHRHG